MFLRKYTKPLSKGELSKLHGQFVRVHFLSDDVEGNEYMGDRIWKVKLDQNVVIITNNMGNCRLFHDYDRHYKESTIDAGVLVYRLPQISHNIKRR